MASMIGTTISHYRIVALLGEGGMGSVWRAEDTLLGRPVALKILAPHLAVSPEARKRFIREARAQSRLEHPGIATVFEAGDADGQAFIAQQLVEGESLARRLESGPFELSPLLDLAIRCSEALAHAHEREVLHRDLSARNVMMRSGGGPVIVDFGLARAHGDATLTATGAMLGTAPYLAPEQWRGEPGDARTDLWALGVVLYQAATGQLPFGREPAESVMYKVLNEDPPKPSQLRPELPAEFERLVLRLLEKDAGDRVQSAAELATAMRGLVTGEEEVPGETLLDRLRHGWRRLLRRHFTPAQVALLSFGVLVLAGALATGVWLLRRRAETARVRVLAVLPLRNASQDPEETAYLGEGLGEELVRRLGAAGGFQLLPWSTTGRLVGERKAPQQLARELRADVLLDGNFSSDGEQVQVLAELVDGSNGHQIWSERYTRAASELIALQTDIATDVARRMAPSFGNEGRARVLRAAPANPEAYDYYVRGLNYWRAGDDAAVAMAEPFFLRAVEIDSTLAVGWVALGAIRTEQLLLGRGGSRDLDEAEAFFRRALRLEPGLPVAERGLIRLITERGKWSDAGEIAEAALRRDPGSVESLVTAGWGLVTAGVPELAQRVLAKALELDPGNESAALYFVVSCCWATDFAKADESGKSYIRRFGEDGLIYNMLGVSASGLGHSREAGIYLERGVFLGRQNWAVPTKTWLMAHYFSERQHVRATALLDSLIEESERTASMFPDNLRARGAALTLLALRGDHSRFVRQWQRFGSALAAVPQFGFIEVPFGLAMAGDLETARHLLADFHAAGEVLPWTRIHERSGLYSGGRVQELLSSAEYRRVSDEVAAERARLLRHFTPLVDRVTREPAGGRRKGPSS